MFGENDVRVLEPCNYSSNVAYYHSTTRICDYSPWSISDDYVNAMKRGFATLAMGSAFFHGSQTFLGSIFDNYQIGVILYIAHQASVSWSSSEILNKLSLE